jgi:hypothetical protein
MKRNGFIEGKEALGDGALTPTPTPNDGNFVSCAMMQFPVIFFRVIPHLRKKKKKKVVN